MTFLQLFPLALCGIDPLHACGTFRAVFGSVGTCLLYTSAPVKMEHIAAQEFCIKQGFCLSDTIEDGYVFMRLFLT